MRRLICLSVMAIILTAPAVMADNSVVIPDQSVAKGATGVVIPVLLTNDVALRGIVMPLIIREQTAGAFVTSLSLGFGDRLPYPGGPISLITNVNQYADETGACKNNQPGGFPAVASIAGNGPIGPNAVAAPPEGLMFSRQGFSADFQAGSDATGSMLLTVDVTSVDGKFEVDTSCTGPANHLLFVNASSLPIIPSFQKGVITIGTGGSSNQPPVAVCQDVSVNADGSCQGTVTPAEVNNGSSDPDGDPITFALDPAGPYSLGANPVKLIVTDDSGDADTCEAAVTVVDNTDPVITSCPGDITVSCTEQIPDPNTGDVVATDNCGFTVSYEGDASDGASCPETVTRTYKVTDNAGHFVTCDQIITVHDTEDPVLSGCPGDVSVQCPADVPPPAEVTASDNCAGVTLDYSEVDNASGNPCGGTIVRTWTATDGCGNTDVCSQTITVNDTEVPQVVACAGDLAFQCSSEVPACDAADAQFSDNCGVPSVSCDRTDNGGLGTTGDPLVITDTYTAVDGCGNVASCSRTITVIDDTPPDPGCPSDIVKVVTAGETEAVVTWTSNYTDNCAGGGVECVPPSGSTFPLGPTTVTCTATDAAGNVSTCNFTVTVSSESVPPVAQCISVTVNADENCQADASIDDGSFDPDGGSVTLSQNPPGPYGIGTTDVELTVTDDEGQSATCTATVSVVDVTPPDVACSADIEVFVLQGETGATVNFSSSAIDNCSAAEVVCTPPSGSFFPVGTTTVICVGTDDLGNSAECSFEVTVSEITDQAPVAVNDHKSTHAGIMLKFVGAGVLTNDNDPDGDPMTAVLVDDVTVGVLTLNSVGSFDYVAPNDFAGQAQFTYYATDGILNSNVATVYINVKPSTFDVADFDGDGFVTALDMSAEADALFGGGNNPRNDWCQADCADFDCSGYSDLLDLTKLIDYLFAGGAGPCDPCAD